MWNLKTKENEKLLVLKISETLTLNELSEFLIEIYDKHDGKYATFDRFVDLSNLREIKIDIETVALYVHKYRRKVKPDAIVKVPLFVPQKYIIGFSHVYKSMLSDELFKLEIFQSLDACADYLSVDKKLLEDLVE